MPKTKYNLGDKVWVIKKRKAGNESVTGIILKESFFSLSPQEPVLLYQVGTNHALLDKEPEYYSESELFPTKEELLASL